MKKIAFKDTISFIRINDSNCIAYDVIATTDGVDEVIDRIENPSVSSPVEVRDVLNFNDYKEWSLPKHTIGNCSSDIEVSINNEIITTNNYTYSQVLKTLSIHLNLKQDDLIIAKYYVDEIKKEYGATDFRKYRIIPIYKKNYKIGRHIKL